MNLDMTFDDLKNKTMKNQPDQKTNVEKAKGLHVHSSRWWCPVAVTLGILCLGLLVTIIMLIMQLSQVSDLLKQHQANLTHQENILEGQILAQKQEENASHELQRELKEMIETLAQKLDEKTKKQMELYNQNLNLQEALRKAANFSGPCPQDWLWHEENCYLFSSGPFNWEKSQENCLSLDAQMLIINSTYDLAVVLEERKELSNTVLFEELNRTMEYCSENLDEDGYTQLDFSSRGITKRTVFSEKGPCVASPPWRSIAMTLGILCCVILVIAVVLGTMGIWRPSSGSSPLKNDNFLPRNKENHSQPTQSSLEESVATTKALTTTGVLSSPCPYNWIMHENSCYLFRTTLDSWNESQRQCSQLRSHLLKIDNSKELEFIVKQVSSHPDNSFWIGLSRPQAEGPWLWEDGTSFSSNLFQIRSTDTQGNSFQNCIWIHISEIYDQLCNVLSYSICEKMLSI